MEENNKPRKPCNYRTFGVLFVVRMTGLEPVRPWATSTSSWPVYQFQHIRSYVVQSLFIIGENDSVVKQEIRRLLLIRKSTLFRPRKKTFIFSEKKC